jgi:hypothetical protein
MLLCSIRRSLCFTKHLMRLMMISSTSLKTILTGKCLTKSLTSKRLKTTTNINSNSGSWWIRFAQEELPFLKLWSKTQSSSRAQVLQHTGLTIVFSKTRDRHSLDIGLVRTNTTNKRWSNSSTCRTTTCSLNKDPNSSLTLSKSIKSFTFQWSQKYLIWKSQSNTTYLLIKK